MDNLAHSLFGAVLARAGLAERYGRGTTALLVVASNLPDVDAILLATHGDEAAWLRRTHTHCVTGGPLLAVLLGIAWWLGSRRRYPLRPAIVLALLGVAGHVGLDLLNSYGVVGLWPFSAKRFELAWVFIMDLAIWAILASPLVASRLLRGRVRERVVHRVALVVLGCYIAACAGGWVRAGMLLDRELAGRGLTASATYVFPEPLGPHRWRGVALEGSTWHVLFARVLEDRIELVREVVTEASAPAVEAARDTPRGRAIERFFKAPVWRLEADGRRATCTDLRFLSLVLGGRGNRFRYEVAVPRGEVSPPDGDASP